MFGLFVLVRYTMNTDSDAEFQPRETRSNTKIATYVPPRIDADAFQADIPQLQDSLPPSTYAGTCVLLNML